MLVSLRRHLLNFYLDRFKMSTKTVVPRLNSYEVTLMSVVYYRCIFFSKENIYGVERSKDIANNT